MNEGTGDSSNNKKEHIIDFNKAREQKLEEKRRKTERIFFESLLTAYSVGANSKMHPIEIIDVSEEGCSFQIPFDPTDVWLTSASELPIRLYFSRETYLEIYVQIQNSRQSIEKSGRFVRYGCKVDQTTKSFPAFQLFVRFLKLYAEQAHRDLGQASTFYL
jgi:hypothetical protein